MTSPLRYYFDENLEKDVPVNELGNPIIDWGESIPGQKKEKILHVVNLTEDNLVLRQPYTLDEDLKIIDYPTRLMRKEKSTVKLEFAPNSNRIEPHKADWGFECVIG